MANYDNTNEADAYSAEQDAVEIAAAVREALGDHLSDPQAEVRLRPEGDWECEQHFGSYYITGHEVLVAILVEG